MTTAEDAAAAPAAELDAVWDRLAGLGWTRDRVETVARAGGGYRNRVLAVTHAGTTVMVRLPRTRLKEADWYRREIHNLNSAAAAGVTPAPLLADPADGLLVQPWIAGAHPVSRETGPEAAARAGTALRRLRGAAAFLPGEDVATRLRRRLRRLEGDRDGARAHAQGLPAVAEACRPLLETLARTAPPPSPCHGDLVLGNLIDDGRTLHLIDWETATQGDPHYDLATVAVRARLETPARTALLAAWMGPEDDPAGPGGQAVAARVSLWEVLYALDKALTYWTQARRTTTVDPRTAGWVRRCSGLLAAPGTRAALLCLETAPCPT